MQVHASHSISKIPFSSVQRPMAMSRGIHMTCKFRGRWSLAQSTTLGIPGRTLVLVTCVSPSHELDLETSYHSDWVRKAVIAHCLRRKTPPTPPSYNHEGLHHAGLIHSSQPMLPIPSHIVLLLRLRVRWSNQRLYWG